MQVCFICLPFSTLSRGRWSCAFLAICSGARQPKFNPFWNRASGINDLYRYGQGSCCPIVGTSIRAFHGLHDDACPAGGHYLSTQSARSRFTTTIWSTRLTFHGTSPRNRDDIILPVRFVTQQHFLGGGFRSKHSEVHERIRPDGSAEVDFVICFLKTKG